METHAAVHLSHPSGDDPERTSNIGTSMYIAPEVTISRTYNEKASCSDDQLSADTFQADMYSLGVIFFEMCFRFKTGMERIHILQALRRETVTFPPAWSESGQANQKEIITGLLRHDSVARPKATQLLASPLLPSPERQKEYYDSAIAGMSRIQSLIRP